MPPSGKLQSITDFSRYSKLSADYQHYPRTGLLLRFRDVLKFLWGVFFWYVGNALWNLIGLFHDQTRQHDLKNVLSALFLPHPLDNPDTPLWVFLIFVLLLIMVIIGYAWARWDLQFEQELIQRRKIHEEVHDDLAIRGADRQFPEPYGPPDDVMSLPHPGEMVGRTAELQWLLKRLRTDKLAALYGPPGIGKTALAAEALRNLHAQKRFRDGIAVVNCEGVIDAVEVLRKVLARFDRHHQEPETRDHQQLADITHRLFQKKAVLIVLDNLEPALDVTKVTAVLRSSRGITFLLTARHGLPQAAIPIKASLELLPLSDKEAFDLFIQSLAQPALTPTTSQNDAIIRIVATLGNHTQTVKIVGSYAAKYKRNLIKLADELNDPQVVVDMVGDDETPGVVAQVIMKSIEALPLETQHLFAALAAFPTREFSREGVLELAKKLNPTTSQMNVELLVPRALVDNWTNTSMPQQSHCERWRLHPLIHMFATTRLKLWTEGERYLAEHAIATYYAGYLNDVQDAALSTR